MKIFTFLLLVISTFSNAQKLERFPADQYSYLGGPEAFYKDFQKILIAKKLKPCENKKELLLALIVVKDDESATLYESDKLPNQPSTCAEDLTKEVLKEMNGWTAAKINGEVKTTIANYFIFPDAFFDHYKEGYTPEKLMTLPSFDGGMNEFRKEVMKRADPSDFIVKGSGKVTVNVKFVVNAEGKMENITLEKSSGSKEYDDMIISSISSIKKKWTPGKIHDYPIRYRFKLPLSFRSY